MKRMAAIFCLISSLSLAAFVAPFTPNVNAQTSAAQRPVPTGHYIAAHEVTLEATVDHVVARNTSGMAPGGHVVLATSSGRLDGSLGPYALSGPKPLSLVPGQRLKVVGVNSTYANKPIFLIRSIDTGSDTANIRTKSGFLITPAMARRAAKLSNAGGAQ